MKVGVNDNILSLIDKTPDLLMSGIAQRVKQRRLENGWTQKMLAAKAGLSLPSYRRFESSGESATQIIQELTEKCVAKKKARFRLK